MLSTRRGSRIRCRRRPSRGSATGLPRSRGTILEVDSDRFVSIRSAPFIGLIR